MCVCVGVPPNFLIFKQAKMELLHIADGVPQPLPLTSG